MDDASISSHVKRCLALNGSLIAALDNTSNDGVPPGMSFELADQNSRFKIWSANIGAHRSGTSSLEYRLRDASHVKVAVVDLLEELQGLVEDAKAILSGDMIPWDQIPSDDGPEEEPKTEDNMPETEMQQIAKDIREVVDGLFRLSLTIKNPAPHDRFMSFSSTDTSYYEKYDVEHVKSKFTHMEPWLAERLGRAVSQRRQYFKYRKAHHDKLAYGPGEEDEKDKVAPSTLASSIPNKIKEQLVLVEGDDESDLGWQSQTSFATSTQQTERLRVPPLPREAEQGPFECPFCYIIISVKDRRSWKKHVYGDLRPYICLERDCSSSGQEFSRRHHWIDHVKQNHWTEYRCPASCGKTFRDLAACRKHVDKSHPGQIQQYQLDALIILHADRDTHNKVFECPFCSEREESPSLAWYRRHVGRHQEQVSLFARPLIAGEYDDHGDHDSTGDELIEEKSQPVPISIEAKDNFSDKNSWSDVSESADTQRLAEAKEAVEKYKQEELEGVQQYRRRLKEDLMKSGLDEDSITNIPDRRKIDVDEVGTSPKSSGRLTYTRMARKHISMETLRTFGMDFEIEEDSDYLVIKRWVPEWEQNQLWNHTRYIREQRASPSLTREEKPESVQTPEFKPSSKNSRLNKPKAHSHLLNYLAGSPPIEVEDEIEASQDRTRYVMHHDDARLSSKRRSIWNSPRFYRAKLEDEFTRSRKSDEPGTNINEAHAVHISDEDAELKQARLELAEIKLREEKTANAAATGSNLRSDWEQAEETDDDMDDHDDAQLSSKRRSIWNSPRFYRAKLEDEFMRGRKSDESGTGINKADAVHISDEDNELKQAKLELAEIKLREEKMANAAATGSKLRSDWEQAEETDDDMDDHDSRSRSRDVAPGAAEKRARRRVKGKGPSDAKFITVDEYHKKGRTRISTMYWQCCRCNCGWLSVAFDDSCPDCHARRCTECMFSN